MSRMAKAQWLWVIRERAKLINHCMLALLCAPFMHNRGGWGPLYSEITCNASVSIVPVINCFNIPENILYIVIYS